MIVDAIVPTGPRASRTAPSLLPCAAKNPAISATSSIMCAPWSVWWTHATISSSLISTGRSPGGAVAPAGGPWGAVSGADATRVATSSRIWRTTSNVTPVSSKAPIWPISMEISTPLGTPP
jgi:hypothetical protein